MLIGDYSALGDHCFAHLRMAAPLELLLGMEEIGHVHSCLRVLEQLGRSGEQPVHGGECGRNSLRRVRANRPGKCLDTLALDGEFDRRVLPADQWWNSRDRAIASRSRCFRSACSRSGKKRKCPRPWT